MNKKLYTKSILVILFFAGLFGAVYFLEKTAVSYLDEHARLHARFDELEAETDLLLAQKVLYSAAFKKIEGIDLFFEEGSRIDFYSEAQSAIQRGGSSIISNTPTSVAGGKINMGMNFTGDYYSALRSLAEMRTLNGVIRIASMNLVTVPPAGNVKIDAVLESHAE